MQRGEEPRKEVAGALANDLAHSPFLSGERRLEAFGWPHLPLTANAIRHYRISSHRCPCASHLVLDENAPPPPHVSGAGCSPPLRVRSGYCRCNPPLLGLRHQAPGTSEPLLSATRRNPWQQKGVLRWVRSERAVFDRDNGKDHNTAKGEVTHHRQPPNTE